MKKILTLAALMGVATLAFGQGEVNFANSTTTRIATNSVGGGPSTGLVSGGIGSYYFALYVAPSTQNTVDASLTGWTFTGAYGTNTATLGRLSGDNTTGSSVVVPGFGVQSSADFVVVGWSSTLAGPDVSQARAAADTRGGGQFFAISTVAQDVQLGGGAITVPNIFGTTAGTIQGFTLALPAPEPTSFALAGLGAAALMIFRRRK